MPAAPPAPQFNFIDRFVDAKLQRLNLRPSAICTDDEFLRRASLDIVGTLPTPDEVAAVKLGTGADRLAAAQDLLKRNKKPSREEMDRNPRASSARLRVIEKVGC